MAEQDLSKELQASVQSSIADKQAINITAGNSKAFYGRIARGNELSVCEHTGTLHYEPTELVITARCGTRLSEIENALAVHNQMLGFEPPHFGGQATLGGCIASGLSGPRRPFAGAARDYVLGMTIINGKGEILHFGGEVMKNVAGYDISRLMTGALGTLGLILDVSLKVLPRPAIESTLSFESDETVAIDRINKLCGQALPVSAASFDGNRLYVRLSGNEAGVTAARKQLGGELLDNSEGFWKKVCEQSHPFFQTNLPLWRISMAPAADPLKLPGKQFIDWGGAQRWLISEEKPDIIFEKIARRGGHATLFKNGKRDTDIFQPLHGKLRELHKNIKHAFDPHGLFNRGRMYPDY